ncbi:hypothetical protein Taro_017231, partial [Colocasia esculenta]|nr:hypothetical protein [Colocasia esculenta]
LLRLPGRPTLLLLLLPPSSAPGLPRDSGFAPTAGCDDGGLRGRSPWLRLDRSQLLSLRCLPLSSLKSLSLCPLHSAASRPRLPSRPLPVDGSPEGGGGGDIGTGEEEERETTHEAGGRPDRWCSSRILPSAPPPFCAMGVLLREALRRLCAEIGWSYVVFWNAIRCGNSRHLVWAEGHHEQQARASAAAGVSALEQAGCFLKGGDVFRETGDDVDPLAELACRAEDRVGDLVRKMRSQVHVVGDGLVGRAAVTGNHRWIFQNGEGYVSECLDEMSHQFSAGMKTIAIIPVLPHGVVQLGSIQMLSCAENAPSLSAFLMCPPLVGGLDIGLGGEGGGFESKRGLFACALPSDGALKDLDVKEVPIVGLPTSLCQSGTACSNLSNLLSFNSENLVPQINKLPIINPLTESSCISGKPLFDKALLSSKPAPVVGGMSTQNCSNQAVVPSNGQLGGQAVLSVADMPLHRTQMHRSSYGSRNQQSLGGSYLSSSSLSYLEGQILSNIRQQRLLSNAPLGSTTTIQRQPHGKTISGSLVSGDKSSNNGNHFGTSGLLSCSMEKDTIGTQNRNSCAIAAAQVVSSANCSGGYSAAQDDWQGNTDKQTQSMSTVTTSNIGYDLFQALENSCSDPKISALYCGPSTFCVQDYWESNPKPIQSTQAGGNYVSVGSSDSASKNGEKNNGEHKPQYIVGEFTADDCIAHVFGDELFDVLGMDFKAKHCSGGLGAFAANGNVLSIGESGADLSTCISQLEDPVFDAMHDGFSSCSGIFTETGPDQLLDAVISQISSGSKQILDDGRYCKATVTKATNSMVHMSSSDCAWASLQQQMHGEHSGPPPPILKVEAASSSVKSAGSAGKTGECSQKDVTYKSQIGLWVENGESMKIESMLSAQCKRIDEVGKSNRKRPRPGESPRPRPKDRQMIQDRVKELREIVPLGAKCSIDALLERTIKHMLFLQSVTKHADKLKETGEPKIISKEGGLLLKDNFEGGATWAFEVGTQSMVCPIIVEDLKPPRQLLVEMLCEERGFFLEIADLIRGLGLTILKGVMEARNDKVWARFAVEANRDVTRMDIFMSLVRLLEPNAGSSVEAQGFDSSNVPCNMVCQSVPATGLANRLQ